MEEEALRNVVSLSSLPLLLESHAHRPRRRETHLKTGQCEVWYRSRRAMVYEHRLPFAESTVAGKREPGVQTGNRDRNTQDAFLTLDSHRTRFPWADRGGRRAAGVCEVADQHDMPTEKVTRSAGRIRFGGVWARRFSPCHMRRGLCEDLPTLAPLRNISCMLCRCFCQLGHDTARGEDERLVESVETRSVMRAVHDELG
jgi:hypothetical protein